MRFLLVLLPALLMAQTAPPKPVTAKPKPAAAKPAAAKPAPPAVPAPLSTDEQKTIYALGLSIYQRLGEFDLSPAEVDILKRALTDAAAGKPALTLNEWGPKIAPMARERSARVAERQKAASQEFLAKAAAQPGAVKTESGLVYRELQPGTGESPKPTDRVKVNYRGTLIDGTEFDSSYRRNQPAEFGLNEVIPCWTEGVQKMKVGGKAQLVCPANLAYGDQGRPTIPPGAALVFEIELLSVGGPTPAPATPPAPPQPQQ